MFKKLALFGAAACFAFSAAASANGLYAGLGVGYMTNRINSNFAGTNPTTGLATTASADFNGDGANGTIFLGYGLCLSDSFWLGLEVNGELSGARHTRNTATTAAVGGVNFTLAESYQHKLRGGWGVSVRPGWFTSDQTKVYGVLGYQRAKVRDTLTVSATNGATGAIATATGTVNSWDSGFRYGGGIETNLTNQLSLRAEFTQTRYKNHTLPFVDTFGAAGTLTSRTYSNQAMVDLVWTLGDLGGLGDSLSNLTS